MSKRQAGNLALCYTRVSTLEQSKFGFSLDAQEQRLRAYCQAAGLEVVELLREEGVSASIPLGKRPSGAKLLQWIGDGIDHVVCLKLDRLFRDAEDALRQTKAWDKAGIALHMVDMGGASMNTASAMGRMFLTLMAGCAELERNLVAERTASVLAHKKQQGNPKGRERSERQLWFITKNHFCVPKKVNTFMKRTKFLTPEEKKEHLDRIVAELGSDVIGKLHRAFELTADALYRRAAEKAHAELNERQH